MAEQNDEVRAALEEARRAREEAEKFRREAKAEMERLREDSRRARDEARKLRDRAKNERGPGHGFGPPGHGPRGHRPGPHPGANFGSPEGDDPGTGARTEHTFALDGVRNILIDQTAGKLTVRPCSEGETPGIVSVGSKTAPVIEVSRDGEKLTLEVKLVKGWLFRRRQGATTIIRLDGSAFDQLRIENGYGETEVSGMTAREMRINVGAGTVRCIQTRGNLDANVGAGKMSILAHAGVARCDSGTGDVVLDVAELAEGEYRIDVGMGRAEVRLPEGGQVHIRATSGIGKIRVDYPSATEDAPIRLRINSGIGECTVKVRDGGIVAEAVKPVGQPRPQRAGRAATASRRREAEELRVLQMLEQGIITPQDAADLIAALQGSTAPVFDLEDGEDEPATS